MTIVDNVALYKIGNTKLSYIHLLILRYPHTYLNTLEGTLCTFRSKNSISVLLTIQIVSIRKNITVNKLIYLLNLKM